MIGKKRGNIQLITEERPRFSDVKICQDQQQSLIIFISSNNNTKREHEKIQLAKLAADFVMPPHFQLHLQVFKHPSLFLSLLLFLNPRDSILVCVCNQVEFIQPCSDIQLLKCFTLRKFASHDVILKIKNPVV